MHLAAGGENFNFLNFLLIHLAAGGENVENSELFTKGILIHLVAGGDFFQKMYYFIKELLISKLGYFCFGEYKGISAGVSSALPGRQDGKDT